MTKTYLDLVISIIKGESPIPEFKSLEINRLELAKEHSAKLRAEQGNKSSGNLMFDMIVSIGGKYLAKTWDKLSPSALSMCGDKSINQLVSAMKVVDEENISGDFIEAGVWRGGLPIIMRAYLHQTDNKVRKVFLADSFCGLPQDPSDPKDKIANKIIAPLHNLSVDRKIIEDGFNYFGLLDDQVEILEGWFHETLPNIKNDSFSIVRLDGDYYDSTKDAITALYPKLNQGGYLIVDDYNLPLGCKRAIDEYRSEHNINDEIIKINKQAVFWRKSGL